MWVKDLNIKYLTTFSEFASLAYQAFLLAKKDLGHSYQPTHVMVITDWEIIYQRYGLAVPRGSDSAWR